MKIIDRCLALEFRDKSLDFALVTRRFNRLKLRNSASLEISWEMPEEEMSERIAETIRENSLFSRKSVVGLPSPDFMFQRITLPYVEIESIRPMLEFELDKHIPFTAGEVYFDHVVLNSEKEETREILLAVIEREKLDRVYRILSGANITPAAIIPSTAAIADYHRYRDDGTPAEDGNNRIAFLVRSTSGGFEISTARGEGIHAIEVLIPGENESGVNLDAAGVLYPSMKRLGLLTGRKAAGYDQQIVDFDGILQKEARETLSSFAPSLQITAATSFVSSAPLWPSEELPPDVYTCTALGARALWKNILHLNLLPEEMRGGNGHYGAIGAGVLGGICLVLTLSIMLAQTVADSSSLKIIETELEHLKKNVEAVTSMEKESEKLEEALKDIDSLISDKFLALDLLKEMSITTPSESWLTRLEFTGNNVKLTGFAKNISDVADLKIKLDKIPFLEEIEELTQSSMRKDKWYFRIGAQLTEEE